MRGLGEGAPGGLVIAHPVQRGDVVRRPLPDRRLVGHARVDHRRALGLDVEGQRFRPVLGRTARLGQHHRHRLAQMPDRAAAQQRLRRKLHPPAVVAHRRHPVRQMRQPVRRQILFRQHHDDARHRPRRLDVQPRHAPPRHRRPQERRPQRPLGHSVGQVAPGPRHEPDILAPPRLIHLPPPRSFFDTIPTTTPTVQNGVPSSGTKRGRDGRHGQQGAATVEGRAGGGTGRRHGRVGLGRRRRHAAPAGRALTSR